MERKSLRIAPYLLILLLSLAALNGFFGGMLRHPDSVMLSTGGDGLKTYFTVEYFVKHDTGNAFMGMNYPHGVHVLYAENPLFLLTLRWFSHHVMPIENHVVGIINLSILLSFVLCALFMYGILRQSHISPWFAAFFAVVISFCSPQVDRMTAHLALAFPVIFPMAWYFFIRAFESPQKWGWWLALFLTTGLASLIHLYYFPLIAGFVGFFVLVHALQNRPYFKGFWKRYAWALGAILLPVACIRLWMAITIPDVGESVKYPYGFFSYTAGMSSVFFPMGTPVADIYASLGYTHAEAPTWEGYAYVGFAGFMGALLLLWRAVALLAKKRWKSVLRPVLPQSLQAGIWAGAIMLFMATAWLFKQYEPASYWIAEVRQFRSVGRLAWVFYYVFMVVCTYYLHAFYRAVRIKTRGAALSSLLLVFAAACALLWGIEGALALKSKERIVASQRIKDAFPEWRYDYSALLRQKGHDPADFQAILALPYFHLGSEKFGIDGTGRIQQLSMAVGVNTGLPLVDCYSSRVPLTQTCESIQLMSNHLMKKQVIAKMPDERPLLLIYEANTAFPGAEKALVDSAVVFCQEGTLLYALLPISVFGRQTARAQTAARAHYQAVRQSLCVSTQGLLLSRPSPSVVAEGFGDALFATATGATAVKATHPNQRQRSNARVSLFNRPIAANKPDESMEVSCWVRIDPEDNYLPVLALRQYEGDREVDFKEIKMDASREVYDGWARTTLLFTLKKSGNRLELTTEDRNFVLDNILFRPVDVEVYLESARGLVYNNWFLPEPSL